MKQDAERTALLDGKHSELLSEVRNGGGGGAAAAAAAGEGGGNWGGEEEEKVCVVGGGLRQDEWVRRTGVWSELQKHSVPGGLISLLALCLSPPSPPAASTRRALALSRNGQENKNGRKENKSGGSVDGPPPAEHLMAALRGAAESRQLAAWRAAGRPPPFAPGALPLPTLDLSEEEVMEP